MITTIIITVCSTLVMVGLIASIAVVYYKLGKRLTKDEFYKHIEQLENSVSREINSIDQRFNSVIDDMYGELQKRDGEIDLIYKKIDSRFDKLNTRIDKLVKALEENGNILKITDSNI